MARCPERKQPGVIFKQSLVTDQTSNGSEKIGCIMWYVWSNEPDGETHHFETFDEAVSFLYDAPVGVPYTIQFRQ
jgi:hypothetical protein